MPAQADEEAALSEDLAERFLKTMLERLRDKQPAVRCQAALALARLADPGEEGDFVGDGVTDSYIRLLGSEKNKVRPACVKLTVCSACVSGTYHLECVSGVHVSRGGADFGMAQGHLGC